MSRRIPLAALPLLALLLLGQPPRAAAHAGGTLQLANETVGPYLMSLWTLPEPPRAGEPLHVSLFLLTLPSSDGKSQDFILDANVAIMVAPAGGGETLQEPGLHIDPNNPFYYEADFPVDEDGAWDVRILVDSPDGSGELSLTVDVLPAERGLTWVYVAAAVVIAAAAGVFLLRARSGKPV